MVEWAIWWAIYKKEEGVHMLRCLRILPIYHWRTPKQNIRFRGKIHHHHKTRQTNNHTGKTIIIIQWQNSMVQEKIKLRCNIGKLRRGWNMWTSRTVHAFATRTIGDKYRSIQRRWISNMWQNTIWNWKHQERNLQNIQRKQPQYHNQSKQKNYRLPRHHNELKDWRT